MEEISRKIVKGKRDEEEEERGRGKAQREEIV